ARAAVQSARDNLRKTTLVAPMTGRVTRLAVEEGEVAVPSTFSKDIGLLLTVSDLSVIQAKVKVDETDVVRVHLGDSVEVSIDALTVRENKTGATESRPADTAAARKKKETEGVFVVKDGVANFRPVKVGVAGDEYFEVTEGLKPGETIVAGPYQAIRDLKEGARVRAMKASADSAKQKTPP